jgi:hypothetical protein
MPPNFAHHGSQKEALQFCENEMLIIKGLHPSQPELGSDFLSPFTAGVA